MRLPRSIQAAEQTAASAAGADGAALADAQRRKSISANLRDQRRPGRPGAQRQFREDLYYRINVVPIAVPPLRDRDGDLPLLVDHFLRSYCAAGKSR